ncbi:glycoside hydrolase family 55 protein [Dyadobacter sp. CY312]|uniref:glycoside hydrolase family 55 protein n=1 Tax=Dyadobacter sp. CY312 TaxID=2907303 RepID=UPI001F33B197|nr:glycoside hydrolase family 55 protein [Dyadobacter sp. CY312]MCE7041272.1 glycoside hydrolase family 55 protein [Dyadobacter sp. CY312]
MSSIKSTYTYLALCVLLLFAINARAKEAIDPIRFNLTTSAQQLALNEEFEIDIHASYLSISSTTVFMFEGSNSFRLKLVMPVGFVQTGGSYSDNVVAELSPSKPSIKYTVIGKFTDKSGNGVFQLLRNHKNSSNLDNYAQVSKLSFTMDEITGTDDTKSANTRIAAIPTPGYIPYLSITDLRSGAADTARVVYITDDFKSGLFRYSASSTQADDGVMTIRHGNRRYERIHDGTVNVNWFGIFGDGTTDQTNTLQSLLNNNRYTTLFFPKSVVSYRIGHVRIYSNKTLLFEDGTFIEGLKTAVNGQMFFMYDASNIVIKGTNVIVSDPNPNYVNNQMRVIFHMGGVTNVLIEGIAANNGGGDGFYIGAGSAKKYSENVKLVNVSADKNRRQGISITGGKNIEIINAVLTNTNGIAPGAGIDVEPNTAENITENVRIINPITRNNSGAGIIVSPGAFVGTNHIVDVVITNHVDEGSTYGFLVTGVTGPVLGTVITQNPIWKNNRGCAFVSRNWSHKAPAVLVQSPTVINANTGATTSPNLGAAFLIYRAENDAGDINLGNIHIFHPRIQDTRSPQLITSSFAYRDLAQHNLILNCSITDPIMSFSPLVNRFSTVYNAELIISDKHEYLTCDFTNYTRYVNYIFHASLYHNASSNAARLLQLSNVNPNFPEIKVEVRASQGIVIVPESVNNILPLSPVNGKRITSNVVGSSIILKKTTNNSWFIKQMIGTWTVLP